jgi:hypothetical protein
VTYRVAMRSLSLVRSGRRQRHGRLLIESCVAIVLLAGGSTMVLLVAAGSARLVDSAVHHDAVLRETATYLAPLLAAPCAAPTVAQYQASRAGVDYIVTNTRVGPLPAMTVGGTWYRSPLARAHTPGSAPLSAQQQHVAYAASWCQP